MAYWYGPGGGYTTCEYIFDEAMDKLGLVLRWGGKFIDGDGRDPLYTVSLGWFTGIFASGYPNRGPAGGVGLKG